MEYLLLEVVAKLDKAASTAGLDELKMKAAPLTANLNKVKTTLK